MFENANKQLPQPTVSVCVGVTGHRLGVKLPEAAVKPISVTAAHALEKIAQCASEALAHDAKKPPRGRAQLSLVSSLAEGADRIVAEAALRMNFSLTAILPFERSIYRHDFSTTDSRAAFDALLGSAETVLELDGRRGADAEAYKAAGIQMLAKADILIAIWNQKPADGEGGTAIIVEHALAMGIPVVVIDPAAPSESFLFWTPAIPAGSKQVLRVSADAYLPILREVLLAGARRPTG